ncbi:uncharacterized protein [Argopecten irradians]|uniref:uncharacterized protein n=1 Tax=Argopecten irradians TaxID=31199 RepID=UPI003722030D
MPIDSTFPGILTLRKMPKGKQQSTAAGSAKAPATPRKRRPAVSPQSSASSPGEVPQQSDGQSEHSATDRSNVPLPASALNITELAAMVSKSVTEAVLTALQAKAQDLPASN